MRRMKRTFPYITVGQILNELDDEGLRIGSRSTFYRLEKRLEKKFGKPAPKRTSGGLKWRVYTRKEADLLKKLIKKEYNFE